MLLVGQQDRLAVEVLDPEHELRAGIARGTVDAPLAVDRRIAGKDDVGPELRDPVADQPADLDLLRASLDEAVLGERVGGEDAGDREP